MIKLIAIDLDGTLLSSDGTISKENLEALQYAHQSGVKIVICTGRPYFAMRDFVAQIGLNSEQDYMITFNGALVQQAADGTIIKQYPLSYDDLQTWQRVTQTLQLPLNAIDEHYVYEPLDYPDNHPSLYFKTRKGLATKQLDYANFSTEHVFNKFVICDEPDYLDEQVLKIPEDLRERYSIFKSQSNLLEIVEKHVTKGNILMELADYLNIAQADVMAIGDQENDLSMIEVAGVGVAMGNAVDAVKQVAQYITADNNRHGVAQAIYHYVKK